MGCLTAILVYLTVGAFFTWAATSATGLNVWVAILAVWTVGGVAWLNIRPALIRRQSEKRRGRS